MKKAEIKIYILSYLKEHKNHCFELMKISEISKELMKNTKFLDERCKSSERIYCYLNDLVEKPNCKYCK